MTHPAPKGGDRRTKHLRPFFSYYGGKHRSVASYPLPRYGDVFDVCAGSAGYATRYADHRVVLVDTNPVICAIWRYLISASHLELRRLPLLGPDDSVDDLGAVPQEARWLVGFWLGKALATPRLTPSPWMKSGKWPGCFWGESIRERIASQVEFVRHWKVMECSYVDVPNTQATWFVDPPYAGKGKYYRGGRPDFIQMADWCRSRAGQVVVCEQEGATWLPFRPHGVIKTLNRKDGQGGYSREVICELPDGAEVVDAS